MLAIGVDFGSPSQRTLATLVHARLQSGRRGCEAFVALGINLWLVNRLSALSSTAGLSALLGYAGIATLGGLFGLASAGVLLWVDRRRALLAAMELPR